MIDRETFLWHWKRICRRFGKKFDQQNLTDAEDYLAFLERRMPTEEFEEAAQAVWATAKWFPRPADFLRVQAGREWRTVLELVAAWDKPTWAGLTTNARLATEAVGGLTSIGAAKDVGRTMTLWLDAYEREVQADAAVLPDTRPTLTPPTTANPTQQSPERQRSA